MRIVRLALLLLGLFLASACNTCRQGSTSCDGACVRLASDALNCGACGNACAAGQVCSQGACAATCADPLATCVQGPSAFCADLRNDPGNCGACGAPCGAGQVCAGGLCAALCVGAQGTLCDGVCVSVATDGRHCGTCGNACPAGQVCSAGACATSCAAPLVICGTGASAACADLAVDPLHCGACGNACPASQTCQAGACRDTCQLAGGTACGGACVNLRSDNLHCGACGNACPLTALCVAGACVAPACPAAPGLPGLPDLFSSVRADSIALADLDRDGWDDVLVTGDTSLEVLPGRGDGTFGAGARYAIGEREWWGHGLLAADLDADGDADVVVTSATHPTSGAAGHWAQIFRNDGSGVLQTSVVLVAEGQPLAADVDGDGVVDLVFVAPSRLMVLRGPTFQVVLQDEYIGATGESTLVPRLADLDGDGFPDLVLPNYTGLQPLQVRLNARDGTFSPPVGYLPGIYSNGAALADLDGDGNLDVAAYGYRYSGPGIDLIVYRNDGAGGLIDLATYPLDASQQYSDLLLADVDGDGRPDAVLGTDGAIQVFPNLGAGVLGSPLMNPSGSGRMAISDVDRDGRRDVVSASAVAGGVSVALGRGQWRFTGPEVVRPVAASQVELGDVDGDGVSDVIAFDLQTAVVTVLRSGPSGLGAPAAYPVPGARAIVVADANLDGRADVLAGGMAGTSTTLLLAEPDGTLGPPAAVQGFDGLDPLVGDVTDDGIPDLVAFRGGPPTRVVLARGRGDGTFEPPVEQDVADTSGYVPWTRLGDVDGDGRPDLVVLVAGVTEFLRVFPSLGGGTFGSPLDRAFPATTGGAWSDDDLVVGDLDGDGRADAAVARSRSVSGTSVEYEGEVLVFRGSPLGFQAAEGLPVRGPCSAATIGSISGAGRRDLLVLDSFGHGVTVYSAGQGGTLAFTGRWILPRPFGDVAAGDLDGDFRDDVVVASGGLAIRRGGCAR